jgi:hypothetical protein
LARASGLTSASPLLVGAAATVAVVGALFTLGAAAAVQLGRWIARACAGADESAATFSAAAGIGATAATADTAGGGVTHVGETAAHVAAGGVTHGGATAPAQAAAEGVTHVGATAPAHAAAEGVTHVGDTSPADAAVLLLGDAARAVLELAAPMLAAAAIAAILVHLAQTRGLWLPRRALPGAPQVPRHDVRRTALDLAGALAIGAVCLGWLWTTAPQLALLVQSPRFAAAALASLLAALAIALLVLGVIDTLVRHVQLASALAMTRDEKREDDRLAAADPRWRARALQGKQLEDEPRDRRIRNVGGRSDR